MAEYAPNSHKSKETSTAVFTDDKKVKKVVTGKVRTKKKSEMSKFKDVFIAEDAQNVKSYIFMDVLVPAVKKAISDIVRDGIDMILYGDTKRSSRSSNSSYVSYRDYSNRDRDRRDDRRTVRSGFDFEDIIFETRGDAEEVRSLMDELLDQYQVVSVADLYDLAGMSSPYTANKYGWTNLRNAEVMRVRDGYILKLPKALPIK